LRKSLFWRRRLRKRLIPNLNYLEKKCPEKDRRVTKIEWNVTTVNEGIPVSDTTGSVTNDLISRLIEGNHVHLGERDHVTQGGRNHVVRGEHVPRGNQKTPRVCPGLMRRNLSRNKEHESIRAGLTKVTGGTNPSDVLDVLEKEKSGYRLMNSAPNPPLRAQNLLPTNMPIRVTKTRRNRRNLNDRRDVLGKLPPLDITLLIQLIDSNQVHLCHPSLPPVRINQKIRL
jgi:hypothetical protein